MLRVLYAKHNMRECRRAFVYNAPTGLVVSLHQGPRLVQSTTYTDYSQAKSKAVRFCMRGER
jgi:hypothetical protein